LLFIFVISASASDCLDDHFQKRPQIP